MAALTKRGELSEYRRKRSRAGPEPSGRARRRPSSSKPLFVVQAHDARRLHYDFRLEVDGVLKSWAVPKGPSTDSRERRLAVATEDHPLEYADFEGVIPEPEHGAGAVIVWDRGTYRNLRAGEDGEPMPMRRALEEGLVEVWLEGRKLQGGYALVRAKLGGNPRNWLLIKMDDEEADARRRPTSTEPESVLSGRTLEDLAGGNEGGRDR